MAIFAKKNDARRAAAKVESNAVDVNVDDPGEVASASTVPGGPEPAAVVQPALADAPSVQPPVVASGVVEPAVVEPVDIEPEVIEPEGIEPATEANGTPAFGIEDAIRLMRSLPADPNMDLVVRVVRVTLGAVNVSVDDIMQDAARKEKSIQDDIGALQVQVDELEKQLYARRCEITAHEADLKETVMVRERLHLADKYTGHRPPPTPPDAAKSGPTRPADWAAEWARTQAASEPPKG